MAAPTATPTPIPLAEREAIEFRITYDELPPVSGGEYEVKETEEAVTCAGVRHMPREGVVSAYTFSVSMTSKKSFSQHIRIYETAEQAQEALDVYVWGAEGKEVSFPDLIGDETVALVEVAVYEYIPTRIRQTIAFRYDSAFAEVTVSADEGNEPSIERVADLARIIEAKMKAR